MGKLAHLPYIDDESQFLITIDPDHSARHKGESFVFSGQNIAEISVGASVYVLVGTANTSHEVALKTLQVVTDGILRVEMYEGAAVSNGGTPIALTQRNRRMVHAADTYVGYNPTITSIGTKIAEYLQGGGSVLQTSVNSATLVDTGWSLKESTNYVFKLTHNVTGTTPIKIAFFEGYIFEINRA